jgi:hypothetical protein
LRTLVCYCPICRAKFRACDVESTAPNGVLKAEFALRIAMAMHLQRDHKRTLVTERDLDANCTPLPDDEAL